ncbi:MAG TPA: OB-fold domain-containing protein [Pseudonocardiaceae bacterium]|jgi:3-hydroxy-3-methylglutaryl CoA synthase
MRGVLGWSGYLPYRRLDLSTIAPVSGTGGGRGSRTVAGPDENSTTMAIEAARQTLSGVAVRPRSLWFATTEPPYLDKTNATAVHAALRLDRDTAAYDAIGSVRSAMGALRAALDAPSAALVVAADLRTGLPGGPDEADGGDGAAALLIGSSDDGPVLAESLAWVSVTEEFLDRWRTPGAPAANRWEERFGATRYGELGTEAVKLALAEAGLDARDVALFVVAGPHQRAATTVAKNCGLRRFDAWPAQVGNVGAAQPALLLVSALERAEPDQIIVLASLSDGADVAVLRTTSALTGYPVPRPLAGQLAGGAPVSYGKFLSWRGILPVEPPRRPEPARPSAPAAWRNREWKFGFVGSTGDVLHLPPSPLDDRPTPMASARGTIVTFTVDRLAYSPSPPVIFAVIDFDGGGRLPMELTDVDENEVRIGGRVELTFRKLFTGEGVHNYFWKARPVRDTNTTGE